MLIIPIGDNVQKRDFPAVGVIIIALCCVVYMYQFRLWDDSWKIMEPYWYDGDDSGLQRAYENSEYHTFITRWGDSPKNVKSGHVMCMVTHQFLHGDFFHLAGNMVMLWAFVGTLESAMGPGLFFTFYILWGVAASATQLYVSWGHPDEVGIGASGAIAGMIGAYVIAFGALTHIRTWVLLPFYVPGVGMAGKVINVPAGAYILFWMVMQIAGVAEDEKYGEEFQSNIAWYAHLGGFAAGAFTMYCMRSQVLSKLARDQKTGELVMKDDEAEAEKTLADKLGDPAAPTSEFPVCPSCGAACTAENRVADTLFRCPTQGCNRLVMQAQALPPPKPSKSRRR